MALKDIIIVGTLAVSHSEDDATVVSFSSASHFRRLSNKSQGTILRALANLMVQEAEDAYPLPSDVPIPAKDAEG